MRHRNTKKTLGRTKSPREALLKGLANSLIMHGRITTTVTKAKVLRPYVERLVTRSRKPSLHVRRYLMSALTSEPSVKKLLADIGPKYADRNGGYTRIIKSGRRLGDASITAIIEFV
jgi:large subunit ribosomal protein L17